MMLATKIRHRFENKELKKILKDIPMIQMKIGWEKDQREDNGMRTAKVAYLNEVGYYMHAKDGKSIHVVARPMMGLACEEYQRHWQQIWRAFFRRYLSGELSSINKVAELFCEGVITDIQNMVEIEKPFAENKPSVAARKNGKPPLIDTGKMIDTLTYEYHKA